MQSSSFTFKKLFRINSGQTLCHKLIKTPCLKRLRKRNTKRILETYALYKYENCSFSLSISKISCCMKALSLCQTFLYISQNYLDHITRKRV